MAESAPVAEVTTPTSVAEIIPTVQQVEQVVSQVQEKAAQQKKGPLTGVETAERVAASLPKTPEPGQKYRIADYTSAPAGTELTSDNSMVITSADGSVEDAIRVFNSGRKDPRTFKQLRVELVP